MMPYGGIWWHPPFAEAEGCPNGHQHQQDIVAYTNHNLLIDTRCTLIIHLKFNDTMVAFYPPYMTFHTIFAHPIPMILTLNMFRFRGTA